MDDDESLWDRMSCGDAAAWGLLYDRHSARLYRFCVRLLGDQDEAEDLLSETFLEVWRCRRTFLVRDGSAAPILLAVARRLAQKRHRSTSRRDRLRRRAELDAPVHHDDVAEAVVEGDDLRIKRDWLRHEVSTLPSFQREVFELAVFAEFTQEEISQMLGIAVGTVKSRLSRARRILQERADDAGFTVPRVRASR